MTLTKFTELSLNDIKKLVKESGGGNKLNQMLVTIGIFPTAKEQAEVVKKFLNLHGPIYYSGGVILKKANKYGISYIHSFSPAPAKQSLDIVFLGIEDVDGVVVSIVFDGDEISEVISNSIFSGRTDGLKRVDYEKSLLWYRDNPGVYNDTLID